MTSSVSRRWYVFFTHTARSVEGLSARELEILKLLVKGHAYKNIADQLAVSVNTVRMFIRRIYQKCTFTLEARRPRCLKSTDFCQQYQGMRRLIFLK